MGGIGQQDRRLAGVDRELLDYLGRRWDELFRLTTLEQGAAALGQGLTRARRLRLGRWLADHPDVHPNVRRWGAPTFVLTEPEKLVGRRLSAGPSTVAALSAAVGAPAGRSVGALRSLGLAAPAPGGRVGLVEGWERLVGPLGFSFHTVRLAGGERFNVP